MQKKLLALAVAGALAPAAAMAQSTVEIYGRANVGVDSWSATGSNVAGGDHASRLRVFDFGSRLGFRVNESLGGGMRAFVVIESGVNIDSGTNLGQSGTAANGSTGFWASRDSYAGIGGNWGDVRFGRQSPFYGNGIIMQAGSNYINNAMDSAFSFGGPVGSPSGRESNVVSYNSPTFGGFNASLSWGPGSPGSEGSAYTGSGQKKEQVMAITGRYTGGALRAQFDWAERSNFTNIPDRDRTGWKVGAGWAYAPGSQISAIFGEIQFKNVAATQIGGAGQGALAGDSPKVQITIFNWEHMFGQFQVIAQAALWGDITGLSVDPGNTSAQGYTLAGKYHLSKRTGVYVSYSTIDNKDNAFWDMSNAGFSSANTAGVLANGNRGADPQVFALGVMHNF